ncbi:RIP metalloprotease RseP [Halpernia frigidisoli]|uniref:Zinc metalloprotease n=1 Tax=Halpernia frigidisoli TaxID=1125876 RepID=A0A1I3HQW1_9FLAO|nr:RIP metalloprotease RseP [Halpernia frigidisoli]SFI38114.1 regulator of sigma E protease [Halpernia frigidisoli]
MTLIQLFQFILSISILVILHELGHFLPAKWFKCKVEKFYLFFDPGFSILKKKIGETEYGIGWLPLGGYVKIAGMVDESMDKEQLALPPQPWEFRSKPAWQRLIIMLGGVTINFLLAWTIYGSLSYFNGETSFDTTKIKAPMNYSASAKAMGFKDGDKIIAVDGKSQTDLDKLSLDILLSDKITVLRSGQNFTFNTNDDGKALALAEENPRGFLSPRQPAIVDTIINPKASASGLRVNDQFISFNNEKIEFYDQLQNNISKNAGKNVNAEVLRNGRPIQLILPVSKDGTLGIASYKFLQNFVETKHFTIPQAVGRGFNRSIESLTYQVKQFKLIFNKKVQGYKKVSGPIGIIKMMPTKFDWVRFWSFTAMFSVWLAFLNLIPIPGLDGGHVVFTLWEMITGKPVPQKVLENAQMIGVIFLIALMALIFGSDIVKWITGKF